MLLAVLLFIVPLGRATAYNIVGIFPAPYRSHSLLYQPLMMELARRGHTVTTFTMFPQKHDIPTYHQVDLNPCFKQKYIQGGLEEMFGHSSLPRILNVIYMELSQYAGLSECQPVMELLNSTRKFDAVITEPFNTELLSAFAYKLNAPSIYFFPGHLFVWLQNQIGAPSNPSYIPSRTTEFVTKLNFFERVYNVYHYVFTEMYFNLYFRPDSERIREQLFGSSTPSLAELAKNTSLVLAVTHFSFYPPMPLPPGVIEICGINVKNASKLPEVSEAVL